MNWIAKYPTTEAPDLDAGALVAFVSPIARVDCAGFSLRRLGFEIRDAISYQTDDIPVVVLVGRVPVDSTYVDQVIRKGVGTLDVNTCRIPVDKWDQEAMERCNTPKSGRMYASKGQLGTFERSSGSGALDTSKGRYPANLMLTGATAEIMDAQSGACPSSNKGIGDDYVGRVKVYGNDGGIGKTKSPGYADTGGASRFYHHFETIEDVVDHFAKLFVGPTKITY